MKPKTILQRNLIEQQAALLVLRLLLRQRLSERVLSVLNDDPLLRYWLLQLRDDNNKQSPVSDLARYRTLLQSLEQQFRERSFYPPSINRIGQRFGLSVLERKLLWLGVLQFDSRPLRDAISSFNNEVTRHTDAARLISRMIGVDASEITQALQPTSRLIEIGLIAQSPGFFGVDDFLSVPYRVASALRDPNADDASLLKAFLFPVKPTDLSKTDYPHLTRDRVHLSAYLQSALQSHARGVNILFHGIPGVGKTQFAVVVAAELGVPMFSVPDDIQTNSLSLDSDDRLAAYRMTQALLAPSPRALIMFDDVEDGVFSSGPQIMQPNGARKASLNNLLESNPVPAIWITNVPEQFDHAHRRRFDLAIEFKPPPRSVRTAMIDRAFVDTSVSAAWKSQLARDRDLTPAQLTSIAKVVRRVSATQDTQTSADDLAFFVYQGQYKLRFGKDPDPDPGPRDSIDFAIDFLNCSHAPQDVEHLFRNAPGITACFYGLPGTGKTAFAHHLARRMDRPLLIKRASDLLRPYLGETEMLICQMFDEARDENAVLLLDEADSFLTDRKHAMHSWEVTQTNELLTQLERFRGVFIATTNAFDVLDAASIRRFDLKVRFDVLTLTQRVRLFDQVLHQFGDPDPTDPVLDEQDIASSFATLTQLTAGDVAVVVRRLRMSGQGIGRVAFLKGLRDECRHKNKQHAPIGFQS